MMSPTALNAGPTYLFRQELYHRRAEYDSLPLTAVVQEALYRSGSWKSSDKHWACAMPYKRTSTIALGLVQVSQRYGMGHSS
jgi:hypothetical protein